ncbi:oligopeptide/dipeptide ABC transporter, ATP-binding protein domain [Paenisporosarcina sp. HGH0030]|uniref:ABC transporter ATP-binding protein n=1 Tax=Paenisporosarcina sp. HGH0030 TaxID=1078085 RepID=UPI00034E762F|nr:ABC transporter ATP-binding protein [Paenisporosarcina sp. HGH0030]EPD50871.1 oligopeptide/dipeptide ABC transporter, ATP-binding protein domain [Paenisporosarcina sp. HGH0030]
MSQLLEVKNLKVSFRTYGGEIQSVRGVSFYIDEGETLAIVGESGCGKSVTAQAVMGMVPTPHGIVQNGQITFGNRDITKLSKKKLQQIRGSEIGMIFQDPMTSLNPTMKIGDQIREGILKHQKLSKNEAKKKVLELLELVGIPDVAKRYSQYPHEFSGGMRQRVVIAIALACNPKLIIADEPTTALDVTIQAQILDLLKDIQQKRNSSIILITHDLGVVAEVADRVAVMYAGLVVESGTVEEIFESPKHPYTWGLLKSVPNLDSPERERLIPIEGSPPDLFATPKGCPFSSRCPFAMEMCVLHMPKTETFSNHHYAKCWLNDHRAVKVKELNTARSEQLV